MMAEMTVVIQVSRRCLLLLLLLLLLWLVLVLLLLLRRRFMGQRFVAQRWSIRHSVG